MKDYGVKNGGSRRVSQMLIEAKDNKENHEPPRFPIGSIPTSVQNYNKSVYKRLYVPLRGVSASMDLSSIEKLPKYKEKEVQASLKLRENLGKIIDNCRELDDGGLLQK